jgi:hypothetical protein
MFCCQLLSLVSLIMISDFQASPYISMPKERGSGSRNLQTASGLSSSQRFHQRSSGWFELTFVLILDSDTKDLSYFIKRYRQDELHKNASTIRIIQLTTTFYRMSCSTHKCNTTFQSLKYFQIKIMSEK